MKRILISLLPLAISALLISSCSDDDDGGVDPIVPDAGSISGGPFTFVVDGIPDNVSGITVDGSAVGTNASFVITDDQDNILGLPATLTDLEGVDFDGAGVGVCFIWYIRYEDGLTGLAMGQNVSGLNGSFDLSNSITVNRNSITAGTISGGPFTFIVDGTADNVSGVSVSGVASGLNTTWVVTDDQNNILGTPPTLEAVEGVDFDGAGVGVCLIWRITYSDGLTGLEMGQNVSGLVGTYSLSNSITVNRN